MLIRGGGGGGEIARTCTHMNSRALLYSPGWPRIASASPGITRMCHHTQPFTSILLSGFFNHPVIVTKNLNPTPFLSTHLAGPLYLLSPKLSFCFGCHYHNHLLSDLHSYLDRQVKNLTPDQVTYSPAYDFGIAFYSSRMISKLAWQMKL